jgi:hypothetical protein
MNLLHAYYIRCYSIFYQLFGCDLHLFDDRKVMSMQYYILSCFLEIDVFVNLIHRFFLLLAMEKVVSARTTVLSFRCK